MPALRGELHYGNRLTEQDVRNIRAEYTPGLITYAELGEQYGVSRQLIHQIITRKIWTHIDQD